MSTQEQLAASLGALNQQVAKIGAETQALKVRIDELSAALASAGQLSPEVEAALSALQAQVQAVDDLVADAPPPAEEPAV